MPSAVAICVNPMSGRDVRRIAARASNMTHEAKRDLVARVASGLDAVGVESIYISREPFRISTMALEWMDLRASVEVIKHELRNTAADTARSVRAYVEAGVRTFVSLGGDGTNRAIVATLKELGVTDEVQLIPLSTGTNNVFPSLIEPTIAGMVAGLAAQGRLSEELRRRAKVLHVRFNDGATDLGLIDAVQLDEDHVGNLLPFEASKLNRMVLTRALPDAVGMSPVGGLLEVVEEVDDCGLLVQMGPGHKIVAPLSPGHFREVEVASVTRLPFDTPVIFQGTRGVLALDGDRDQRLRDARKGTVTVRRDGPWVLDVPAAMRYAVANGMMSR